MSTGCRLCGTLLPAPYLDLGKQPLANALLPAEEVRLIKTGALREAREPLAIARCRTCGLSQLTETIKGSRLFSDYRYMSGAASGWREHCQGLVESVPGTGLWVDIGSNDGTLLDYAKAAGYTTWGVDPAVAVNETHTHPVLASYWNTRAAKHLTRKEGKARVITAMNVFAHAPDPVGFLRGIKEALAPEGVAIVEVPSLWHLWEAAAFDTIYHEHLTYWSIETFGRAAREANITFTKYRYVPVHGGSHRFYLSRDAATDSWGREDWNTDQSADLFAAKARGAIRANAAILTDLRERNLRVWGYAASAKATVRLNAIDAIAPKAVSVIQAIVDDSPLKWGYHLPGVHTPIVKGQDLREVDVLVILAPNWSEGIQARAREWGFRGEFVTLA